MDNILKSGSCSIVLGSNYYSGFIEKKKNKLLKISNVIKNHNEFKYLSIINKIKNYEKYYCIPDEPCKLLDPSEEFYKDISKMVNDNNIFNGNKLHCFYINYAGDKELNDVIFELDNYKYTNYWSSYGSILKFTKHIMDGIRYLHMNKICHLDIKPENIIINTKNRTSKIIDFGFASMEPFYEFINDFRGTPGYFPKYFPNEKVTEWLPIINANDFLPEYDGIIPIKKNPLLVYKIDSYCFGRLLYFLKYIYDRNIEESCFSCFSNDENNNNKLDLIIDSLLDRNIKTRITITDCYSKFF